MKAVTCADLVFRSEPDKHENRFMWKKSGKGQVIRESTEGTSSWEEIVPFPLLQRAGGHKQIMHYGKYPHLEKLVVIYADR